MLGQDNAAEHAGRLHDQSTVLTFRTKPFLESGRSRDFYLFEGLGKNSHERDARRVFDVLPKRLAKYGLTLHPEKTRLVDFRRPDRRASVSPEGDARSRPGTFDLLGFTHYWAMSR